MLSFFCCLNNNIFYLCMQIFLSTLDEYPHACLRPEEIKHCIKVLRHQVGDVIYTTEGKGVMYRSRIEVADKQKVELSILEAWPDFGEHAFHIRLLVSPLRLKDRFEWIMEKAVELGVNEIIPLQCQRTDGYKAKFKEERINGILETALKQCKRSQLPLLQALTSFEEQMMVEREVEGLKIMGFCEEDKAIQDYSQDISKATPLSLLIGPEGDFTEEEVELAKTAGFYPVLMGENRLRTETAAIYGLSIFKMLKGY
jgi:16S rRNA (uracil1498-N3)-methyltransferase